MAEPTTRFTPSKDMEEKLTRIFKSLDQDESGFIEVYELTPLIGLLAQMGIALDKHAVERLVIRHSRHRTGELNFDEFSQMLLQLLHLKNKVASEKGGLSSLLSKLKQYIFGGIEEILMRPRTKQAPQLSTFKPKVVQKFHKLNEELKEKPSVAPEIHVADNAKYEDPEFPLTDQHLPHQARGKIRDWKRPHEISDNPQLFLNGVEEGDVMQGHIGNCWFISAMATVASSSNDLIKESFVRSDLVKGYHQVRFYKDFEWVTVTVDDRLPVGEDGQLYFASCKDKNEYWVPIMEKAYAKLYGGYASIESGSIVDALHDLTGEGVEIIRSETYSDRQEIWKLILSDLKESFLMGCAIERNIQGEAQIGFGLIANHAYSIIHAEEVKGIKLLRLRNPWGNSEWMGAWSDNSREWTPDIKEHFNYEFDNDGTFFMEFRDFVRFFNRIHVVRLLTDDVGEVWRKYLFKNAWIGERAGGCTNHETWINNPQYSLAPQSNTKVFVCLTQQDIRHRARSGNPNYHPIGVLVMKMDEYIHKKPTTIRNETNGTDNEGKSGAFIGQRSASFDFTANLEEEYIIIPCTFDAGVEAKFELTVYSQNPVHVSSVL